MKKSNNQIQIPLAELAGGIAGRLEGDGSVLIAGVAPIESAGQGEITFVANPGYAKFVETTNASAVILDEELPAFGKTCIRHKNPYYAFALCLDLLYPTPRRVEPGIHGSCVIEPGAGIEPSVGIGPLCHVCEDAEIGEDSQLLSSVYVGREVSIGKNCLIYPGVRIMDGCRIGNDVIVHSSTVIGSDGFGFAEQEQGIKKIKQIGWVEIEDEVEIGSNCSIDRGALGPTRIGRGTKIDNLVQIAHNVQIGPYSILVAQVGVSGSTKIGSGVVLAGQAGVVGHLTLGDGVKVAAQSGVSHSIAAGKTVLGSPAREIGAARRIEAAASRLPELLKRVRKIEKQLAE